MARKLKIFRLNHSYRGRYFDFRLCDTSAAKAAERLGVSKHHLETYGGPGQPTNEIFDEIWVTPYCHKARELFESKGWYELEEVKKKIDIDCDLKMSEFLKSLGDLDEWKKTSR